ncbi:MAG: hypothetical protein HY956_10575 [Deltaproteobacteria bacterium]|nr:hypothetical protein [Deltaproteobacteria bacterium]
MKNSIFYAFVLSVFLAVFSMNAVNVHAAEAEAAAAEDAQKQQSKAVKQTQQAIDNLKSAIRSFEQAQRSAGEDEHLKEAVNSAKTALDSAEKSMEHARLFQSGAAAGKGMTERKGAAPGTTPAPSEREGGTMGGGTTGGQ